MNTADSGWIREIKEEIYGPEPEKNEVEIILEKIHKAELAITKQEDKIERLKEKLEKLYGDDFINIISKEIFTKKDLFKKFNIVEIWIT